MHQGVRTYWNHPKLNLRSKIAKTSGLYHKQTELQYYWKRKPKEMQRQINRSCQEILLAKYQKNLSMKEDNQKKLVSEKR